MVPIQPTSEQLKAWTNSYVPKNDFFFINHSDLVLFSSFLSDILAVPREEFLQHSAYTSVEYSSSLEYWQIKKEADLILIAPFTWYEQLSSDQQKKLLQLQSFYNRGLIIPLAYFQAHAVPPEAIVSDHVVVTSSFWRQLPQNLKEQVLVRYAKDWDEWSACPVNEYVPDSLTKIANTFPNKSVSNCLSTVLFALSKNEWFLHQWVHQETFLHYLLCNNYQELEDEILPGDVLIFKNNADVVVHGTYCVEENLFFNKHGQTLFNPWKLVTKASLNSEWGHLRECLYRKQN